MRLVLSAYFFKFLFWFFLGFYFNVERVSTTLRAITKCGFRYLLSKVEKLKQPCLIENVGGVDEDVASIVPNQTKSSSLSNVESVHLETLLDDVNVSKLVVVTMPKGGIYD